MSSLEGARIVVAGGTGGVGEGIVRTLLKEGARVIATSRNGDRLRDLQAYCGDIDNGELITLTGDLGEEEPARALQHQIFEHFRELDVAVASLGSWTHGKPLTSVDVDVWNRILRDSVTAHFLAIRMLVPLLHPKNGSYVHINGFGAEQAFPMGGPIAMAAAAQKSLVLTLAEELKPTGIRVFELILGPVNTRDRVRHGMSRPELYSSEEVGQFVATLVTSDNTETVHRLLSKQDQQTVH